MVKYSSKCVVFFRYSAIPGLLTVCEQDQDGTCLVLLLLVVEFYSKNKFEKLVHLIGFIIRIYHDTRSSERQINNIIDKNYKINTSLLKIFKILLF